MIRLIAMDMDGTLLGDNSGTIPAENVRVLRLAAERGITLALCSGRTPDDAGFFAVDAGLDMHVLALNGTCCMDRPLGPIVVNQPMQAEDAFRVRDLLDAAGVMYGMFGGHELILSEPEKEPSELPVFWGAFLTRAGGRTVVRYSGEGGDALIRRGVNKFVAIDIREQPDLSALRATLDAELPGVETTSSWVNNLEINARGMNKGTAVTALARRLGIPMRDVMTLGDNDNDIPMLTCAGYGVAMANSTPGAMAAAGWTTTDNASCGVAAAVRALALCESVPGVGRRK